METPIYTGLSLYIHIDIYIQVSSHWEEWGRVHHPTSQKFAHPPPYLEKFPHRRRLPPPTTK